MKLNSSYATKRCREAEAKEIAFKILGVNISHKEWLKKKTQERVLKWLVLAKFSL